MLNLLNFNLCCTAYWTLARYGFLGSVSGVKSEDLDL